MGNSELTIQQALSVASQHHQAGRLAQAEQMYRQILARQPNHPDALHSLGVLAGQVGRGDAAVELIRRAAALCPNDAAVHSDLGTALRNVGRSDEAIAAYRRAIALKPGMAQVHYNLGIALNDQGQLDQAAAAYRRAITLKPDLAEAYSNLGTVLKDQGQTGEALAAYRRAIALKRDYADAHSSLGVALQDQGQLDKAVAAYQQAIVLKPDFADPHYNLGLALLLQGEFAQGWAECEWRWGTPAFSASHRDFAQPQWDGRPIEGRTLLLHAEQGLGDAIQFVRYLPLVVQRAGHGHVALECQPELLRLLQPLADGGSTMLTAGCQLIGRGQPLPAFDVHCPLLSLPLVFATSLENLPCQVPYLRPAPGDIDAWRQRLAAEAQPNDVLNVGLVWAGNPRHRKDRSRSISLNRLAPLGGVPGVRFVSLQKEPAAAQLQVSPPGLHVLDLTSELNDMADTAALIANLDLVIGVDTAVVHLAGAMARSVWTLLPWVPDWRWLRQRNDSPWYPGMRLFRQPKSGDWDTVVAAVAEALLAWAKARKR